MAARALLRQSFIHCTRLPIALPTSGCGRKKSKTKDLIGLLLSHGARAWRYSQPEANIHLHVSAQAGRFPVILRLR